MYEPVPERQTDKLQTCMHLHTSLYLSPCVAGWPRKAQEQFVRVQLEGRKRHGLEACKTGHGSRRRVTDCSTELSSSCSMLLHSGAKLSGFWQSSRHQHHKHDHYPPPPPPPPPLPPAPPLPRRRRRRRLAPPFCCSMIKIIISIQCYHHHHYHHRHYHHRHHPHRHHHEHQHHQH